MRDPLEPIPAEPRTVPGILWIFLIPPLLGTLGVAVLVALKASGYFN